ncbi:circularly permuted type 2 ATP-grasp protein [Hyphomicrobium sp. CS1GBMeth3]|uniref:circularly permuted type 2 ATP-grasp protein n=1 Tax=Hyphomicrobium sp. CS1GBMeth3 TaxID=1892845 RepID=UPI00093020FA|nr:circularly permuted type 2 ATP-grasp protein [Hyphomicrobium sp. CS1GBMeth3]
MEGEGTGLRVVTTEAAADDGSPARQALIGDYRPAPGVYDEMVDAQGRVRGHWSPLVDRLAAEPAEALAQRFAAADRYLKDSGVFYRVYDDPAAGERPWPLAHVPLLISPEDWAAIEAGAIQRARLMEAILADAYSGGEKLAGLGFPAALMAGSPDFLRPLVQAGPPPRQLYLYAIDLGRSPTGQWWVLSDRTQAPSGAGYALENRIALSRALSDVLGAFDVHRLASFFDAQRVELASHREVGDAGVCLLTPGPLNETSFEHAYLARYLGFRLVEGMDLMVLGGEVYLRTVNGLHKVRVLMRRIDGDFADPLELNARSRLGIPGLARAARRRSVTLANALGSGLAESRALLGFLPGLARNLLGEELMLPHLPTLWCGEPAVRDAVLARLDAYVIAPAFSRTSSGIPPGGPWVVSEMDDASRAKLSDAIARRGVDFVAQEVATLSTTPVWDNGQLEPHPFNVRVFVAATADGYVVMPGGFALIGKSQDLRAVSMQRGARSADVWVLANGPVAQTTLIPGETQIIVRRDPGVLPSRAADNLFWLARYTERAEATLRLVRALAARVSAKRSPGAADLAGIGELLFRWGATDVLYPAGEAEQAAETALRNTDLPGAVPSLIAAARQAGLGVRERFPPDAWRALEDLHAFVHAPPSLEATDVAVFDRANQALRTIAAVTGYQLETMNRVVGWRFLKLGFRIERALATCRFVRQFARRDGGSREEMDLLLELDDCQLTYRSRYPFGAAFAPVVDLVLIDESNPRSLAFQMARLKEHMLALPLLPPSGRSSPAVAVADRLYETVVAWDPALIQPDDILGIENGLMHLSDEITFSFFRGRERLVAGETP